MSGEAWLFLFAVLINAVNLFLQVFFTIMYSDLEWYVTKPPARTGRRGQCLLSSAFSWPDLSPRLEIQS